MAGKIVSARLMLRQAAELMDQGHPAASAQCAIAKKIATDQGKFDLPAESDRKGFSSSTSIFARFLIGFEVCNDALQMLGGYGYLKVSTFITWFCVRL
jgi:alkylation response protein AidB-like acyl-CoA dehydrogenase